MGMEPDELDATLATYADWHHDRVAALTVPIPEAVGSRLRAAIVELPEAVRLPSRAVQALAEAGHRAN
ncbi:hypothetical protein [Tsukamurella soli]|uniref:Uncharacterized protein n=1 Tax=Tsukamurella soli TaxID=644556 RepID=A0ABP8J2H2_9ACTN